MRGVVRLGPWLALSLALLLAPLGAAAQAAPPCPPRAAVPSAQQLEHLAAEAPDRGFLWRIEKDGRRSYLYGTVHLARLAWTAPGPQVAAALRDADLLALEIDADDPAMAARLRGAMAAQPRFPLPTALDARLRAQLARACLPPLLLELMSPEMVATTLLALSARVDGLDPAWGVDPSLGRAARALGKPVQSLETPELQFALLASADAEAARESVEKMLDALERGEARPMLQRVTEVWADSRFDELQRYLDWCDCVGTERERAQMAALLDGRNPALAEGIDALHRGGRSVFAAVGSLHMIGSSGLPALLAARGYSVARVAFKR